MTPGNHHKWPFLSPTKDCWAWIPGPRGQIRTLVTNDLGLRARSTDDTKTVLDAMERMDHLARGIGDDTLLLVTEAYRRGAPWSEIARRLGRTKQTVHRHFQAKVNARPTEELLRRDLLQARQRARHIAQHGTDRQEIIRAAAFIAWADRGRTRV